MKQPTKKGRNPFCFAIIGCPGSGKTTFANSLIDKELANGGKALILNIDFSDWHDVPHMNGDNPDVYKYTNEVRKIIGPNTKHWNFISTEFRNGLIIAEECRHYVPKEILSEPSLQKIMQRKRQYAIDLAFLAHGVTQLPPGLMPFFTHFIQFATLDSIDKRRTELGQWYPLLKNGESIINRERKKNPYYHIIHEL